MGDGQQGDGITQTQDERNYHVLRSWFPRWVWNTGVNFPYIKDDFEGVPLWEKLLRVIQEHKKRGQIHALYEYKDKYKGIPAAIAGAGPSFDKAAPFLKKWKGAYFCPESMIKTSLGYGREPDYIGFFDAGQGPQFFSGLKGLNGALLTHPAVNPGTLRLWKGDSIYYAMMHLPNVEFGEIFGKEKNTITLDKLVGFVKDQLLGSDFFEEINPILFPFIGTSILNAGCVVNNMIQIAHFMGYDPLFLIGCDFGFPGDVARCSEWHAPPRYLFEPQWLWRKRWRLQESVKADSVMTGREIKISANGIKTTEEQLEYKIAFMSVLKLDRPNLFDCSDGIITEVAKKNFAGVVENGGRGYEKEFRGADEIVKICDGFLTGATKVPAK